MIPKTYMANFKTLCRAVLAGDVALMECTDVHTRKPVVVLCMVSTDKGEFLMTPVAKMFDGNPYEELVPPGAELP